MPVELITHFIRGKGKNPHWAGGNTVLAEVASIQMEFLYLAKASKENSFAAKVISRLVPPFITSF